MDETDPLRIGPYEVLSKLADGGVGSVYLARKTGPAGFRREVAVKRLHSQFAADPNFVTMFLDEARLAARIHHANVVSIIELGADDDIHYVVMDYVAGSNLGVLQWQAARSGKALPRSVALRIMLDALSGLHAAHELRDDDGTLVNLVHRDVSPQNVLVGTDGVSRLSDFGIARAEALREYETRGAMVKGKLEYMAPEQVECKAVDRTTDLFALGILLWEILACRRLFHAPSHAAIIQRVCFDPIPSPRQIDPTISLELERVCARALERAHGRRYPTADAFAEDLEAAARRDTGIATQREVAACLLALTRTSGAASTPRQSDPTAARTEVTKHQEVLPLLVTPAEGGSPPTQQLPPSDPLLPVQRPSADRSDAHQAPDTVPHQEAAALATVMDGPSSDEATPRPPGTPRRAPLEASSTQSRSDDLARTSPAQGRRTLAAPTQSGNMVFLAIAAGVILASSLVGLAVATMRARADAAVTMPKATSGPATPAPSVSAARVMSSSVY